MTAHETAALETLVRRELRLSERTPRGAARAGLAKLFQQSGLERPDREAALLIGAAAGLRPVDLIAAPEAPLGEAAAPLAAFAARRLAGEPLSRIVARREFWGLTFAIHPDVLDPRADTETVVEAAVAAMRSRRADPLRVLDLGVGSGALLCALLGEFPNASGVGVDLSPGAAAVASANVEALGFAARAAIRVGNWGAGLEGPFDLVVANPPYIASADIAALEPEVRLHDPWLALDGGADGLAAYRALAPELVRLLAPREGWFGLEFGRGQASEVRAILEARRELRIDAILTDLAGMERVVSGRRI